MSSDALLGQAQSVEGEVGSAAVSTHPKGEHSETTVAAQVLGAEQPCPPSVGLPVSSPRKRMARCRHCKERVLVDTMAGHQRRDCPNKQPRRPDIACVCGCGAMVEQPERGQQRNFLDFKHYKAWRTEQTRGQPKEGRSAPPVLSEEDKERLQMAPRRAREAWLAAEAAKMGKAILTGEASYALWGDLLGVAL